MEMMTVFFMIFILDLSIIKQSGLLALRLCAKCLKELSNYCSIGLVLSRALGYSIKLCFAYYLGKSY